MDLMTLEKEKLENKYKELCKEEYPGRLGKTFKTKYNFYYYDSGTGGKGEYRTGNRVRALKTLRASY